MSKKNSKTGETGKQKIFVLSLPHTQVTDAYVSCAYTMKAKKLADMLVDLGYDTYIVASEDNQTKANLITAITKKEQHEFFGNPGEYRKTFYNITWGPQDAHWVHFNNRAIEEISKRIKPGDIIMHFAGYCQKQVADAFPHNRTIEAGIGYTGVYGRFNVYESYAHMHYVHGVKNDDNGNFYDTVIPNYYDPKEFPFAKERGDEWGEYFLFVGRLIDRKGYAIAQEVCEKLGKRLILAGQLDKGQEFRGYGEHIGTIGVEERGRLMSRATALFVPTTYLGPFEGVHAEALLCGTPVITTNFGVFTETVENDFNGQRCDVFRDFLKAVEWSESLDEKHRRKIRREAQKRFGMKNVAKQYDDYIKRINDLSGDGWYAD